MVIAREKGVGGRRKMAREELMGTEKDYILGDKCMMQYAHDVLLTCTLETCMVLLTNVTPKIF